MSATLTNRVRAALAAPVPGLYLNSAAEGLPLAAAREGFERYLTAKSRGSSGRAQFEEIERDARAAFSRLMRVAPADVAFVASTSRALDAAIKSIRWAAGDAIVVPSTEFPTALFAARLLADSGVEVRTVPAAPDGLVAERDIVAAIDERVRLVVVSAVSFRTGQLFRTDEIIERAHDAGALVFLDCVQALGHVDFAVGEADFAAAASFKWLQGIHGAAGLVVSNRARAELAPPYAAYRGVVDLFPDPPAEYELWDDARRFQEGLPDYAALAVLAATEAASAPWREEAADHNRQLGARLLDGLRRIGADVLAPTAERGSIVAFRTPRFAEIASELERAGTTVWARDGRVRLSPHVYTSAADVDGVIEQLDRVGVA